MRRSIRWTIAAVLPMSALTQDADGCRVEPVPITPGFFVASDVAAPLGDRWVVLARWANRYDLSDFRRHSDTSMPGVVLGRDGRARPIPPPFPSRFTLWPWAAGQTARGPRFLLPVSDARGNFGAADSIDIYAGVFDGRRWRDLSRVHRVYSPDVFTGEATVDPILVGDTTVLVMRETGLPGRSWFLTTLRLHGGRWTVERDSSFGMHIHGVDLVTYGGERWLAVVGSPRASWPTNGMLPRTLHVSRWRDGRWSQPERVPGASVYDGDARFLPTAEGLYIAWASSEVPFDRTLHWRGLTPGADTTTHSLKIEGRAMRGSPPWQDVLVYAVDSSTTVVGRPGPGGMRELTRLPALGGRAPHVMGTRSAPFAFGIADQRLDPQGRTALFVYDLRCALSIDSRNARSNSAARGPRPR